MPNSLVPLSFRKNSAKRVANQRFFVIFATSFIKTRKQHTETDCKQLKINKIKILWRTNYKS